MYKVGRIRDGALALGQAIAILFLLMANPAAAVDDTADAQKVVDAAKHTFNNFQADPEMTWFREHLSEAQGVLIAPEVLKAGFIFGGSGGNGVLLARDKDTGEWSDPAFYSIGSVTFGLQIGAQASELVMMVMTQKGLDSLLTTSAKLGADVAVAAGPVGAGAAAATADVFSFSRTKGIYGGLNVEGSVVKVQDGFNEAYYGKPVSPIDIMITRTVGNPQAAPLVEAISHAGRDG